MPSLNSLLAAHGNTLVLDAASARVQVGLFRPGHPALWRHSSDEAGTSLFTLTSGLLTEARTPLTAIEAFLFCEGPGSMLGTRTIAMALRTWQILRPRACYVYQSLAVAGYAEWLTRPRAFAVIADARRDSWHVQAVDAQGRCDAPLARVPTSALPAGECVTPENFRAWTPLPATVRPCSYDLAAVFAAIPTLDCFLPCAHPDAFQHEAPEYKKWSAQIHRAPAPLSSPAT